MSKYCTVSHIHIFFKTLCTFKECGIHPFVSFHVLLPCILGIWSVLDEC